MKKRKIRWKYSKYGKHPMGYVGEGEDEVWICSITIGEINVLSSMFSSMHFPIEGHSKSISYLKRKAQKDLDTYLNGIVKTFFE